jgi:hypothetical protein
MLIALLDVEETKIARMPSADGGALNKKKAENQIASATKKNNTSTSTSSIDPPKNKLDKKSTNESSPITSFVIGDDEASLPTDFKNTTTPKNSNGRIIDSAKKLKSGPSQNRQRRTSKFNEPSSQLSNSSATVMSTTSASRVVVHSPDTTQFALHTLKEYAEFNNVFTNPNVKTNVRHFHAFITDLGAFVNTKNTPMREMAAKKLTKIEDTTNIRNTFGAGIGVQIVNAVRDIILLLIPQIVSKYKF